MKKTLLIAGALLALTASVSFAGGVNLSWTDCGTFGTLQKNFACTSNNGVDAMVASAVAGQDMGQLNGHAAVIDLQTNQAALSAWWSVGGCRLASAVSADFNFLSGVNCLDPWAGQGAGGINYAPGFNAPNRARIRTVCAIPGNTAIDGVSEYYIVRVNVGHAKTTGNGSCAGCTDGVCIVLNSITLTQPLGVGDVTVSAPITRNYVQYQGGGNIGGQCPAATPTRSATWGSVKSLYR